MRTKEDAYNALSALAERIGNENYESGLYTSLDRRGKRKNGGYTVTEEHKSVIDAMEALTRDEITAEDAMVIVAQHRKPFTVHWIHTGKFEADYTVPANSREEAEAYVAEHRLELDPENLLPLSDDYLQFL